MFDADELTALLPRLWRFALVLSRNRDTASDLAQSACLRALEKKHLFKPGTHLDRWVFSILANIWRNELRSQKIRASKSFTGDEPELAFDGVSAVESNILASQLLTEVMKLPDAQKEAVLLVYIEGLKYREASELLEVPIGTIMSRLSAARAKLSQFQSLENFPGDERGGGKNDQ